MTNSRFTPKQYQSLQKEAQNPFRAFRRFFYWAFLASGSLGGFVCFFQVLAGRNLSQGLTNLALQVGLIVGMIIILKYDRDK